MQRKPKAEAIDYMSWRICFLGSDAIGLTTLRKLYENYSTSNPNKLISHLEVVVASGYLNSTGSRAKQVTEVFAKENGLLVHYPNSRYDPNHLLSLWTMLSPLFPQYSSP